MSSVPRNSVNNGNNIATKDENGRLLSAKVFECYLPPPPSSFQGVLIPKVLTRNRRRRLISVEIRRVQLLSNKQSKTSAGAGDGGDGRSSSSYTEKAAVPGIGVGLYYDECSIRVLSPASKSDAKSATQRARERRRKSRNHPKNVPHAHGINNKDQNNHQPNGSPIADGAGEESDADDDDDSSTVAPAEYMDDATESATLPDGVDELHWKPKYRFPLRSLTIKGMLKTTVTVEIAMGKTKQVRQLVFDSLQDAETFQDLIESEKSKESRRTNARMSVMLGDTKIAELDEQLTFLIEIVSAWDIPLGDFTSSDPYVICLFENKEVHRTQYIPQTLDPIWTIKTGSLFLFKITSKALFRSEGLDLLLWDYDQLGAHERLGQVKVSPKTIYDATGERLEFKLQPPFLADEKKNVSGYMAIRCRRATEYDIKFLQDYVTDDSESKKIFDKAIEYAGGSSNITSIIRKRSRLARTGPNAGQVEYKIRPGPNPDRVAQTTWMTKEAIEEESRKKSEIWVDIGTGRLGRLFVEIIACDDLPNLDTGGFAGNKTDAFVSLIFEDSVVRTDVIDDTCAPRWLPWTKRAFIFHMHHCTSQLFLGVFDYDPSNIPGDTNDFVGRVTVDISNFQKDTVYTLKYNLYTTARMSTRKVMGSIILRLRLEIGDERGILLSNLEPPPQMYVNARTKKEFRVITETCSGNTNMDRYSMKVINSYLEELMSYQRMSFYLQDGAVALLLWRGTYKFNFGSKIILLPIHSMTAFLAAVLLVEWPQLIPSFFFAGFAWLLIAVMNYRRNLPDRWDRCRSYREFLEILLLGESQQSAETIEPYDNYQETKAWVDYWRKRVSDAEEQAMKAYEESLQEQEENEKEMEEIGEADVDISTKTHGMSIDPFKPILFPVQQHLAMVCRYSRHINHIVTWEECYISFWVTTGCLLLAIVCFFVPWFFIIKWTARIVVWVFFGPWMKLVDLCYVSKIKPLTKEELAKRKEIEKMKRRAQTFTAVAEARIKRENAAKLKAMKKYMFGKFITRVPALKEDRFRDAPLPESSAVPHKPDLRPLSELAMQEAGYKKIRVPGQHLVGDMIPKIDSVAFTEAPIGQATAHPALLDRTGVGGAFSGGGSADSTLAAYARIFGLVSAAALLTWFGVPLMATLTERFISSLFWFR